MVLVVDDDPAVRSTADILTGLGYNVLQAANGDAALEILNTRNPIDLLLTDVVMTGMNGPDLARRADGAADADPLHLWLCRLWRQ